MASNVAGYDFMTTATLNSAVAVAAIGANDVRYIVIPVTKAAGDVNTYAGNLIGSKISDMKLKNVITATDGTTKLDVDYTLYVTAEAATMADNSVGTYVIGVLYADYSEHIA